MIESDAYDANLIYSKYVDKSVLWDGFSIKNIYLQLFTGIIGKLAIGERRKIRFLLNGKIYDGIELKNLAFSRSKYPTHKDIYQVRYSPNSEFSKELRNIYSDVWEYISEQQAIQRELLAKGFRRKNIKLPVDLNRTIAFYTSAITDVWIVETYGVSDNKALYDSMIPSDEFDFECSDGSATIIERTKQVKLRVLNRSIGNNLKKLYDFRCQICGESIGVAYGNDRIVDAHHIDPFTSSYNNNFDNIMILCPNHHRIIHSCNGTLKKSLSEIWYPNGLHEKLLINLHL